MQQKINTTAFRLGKRICWVSTWCENPKTFIKSFFFDLELRFFVKLVFEQLGFFEDNLRVKKNAKISRCFAKVLSFDDVIGKWFLYLRNITETSKLAKELRDKKQKKYSRDLTSFFGYHVFEYRSLFENEQNNTWDNTKKTTFLPVFSGQLFCNYIAKQISLSLGFKNRSFRGGFENALKKVARKCIKTHNFQLVSGIKIICSGKWKKTKNGRTQKSVIKIGRLQGQSIVCLTSYGISTSVTKFGCCGIKVWISYKPILVLVSALL